MNLLFKISYGLYILSASWDGKDNACMINTLMQQTSTPERLSVTVNKANYTHELIERSGRFSVSVLSDRTKFDTIKNFGMSSGRDRNKFAGIATVRAGNGTLVPVEETLGYFEMEVESSVDMGSHTMFVASIAAIGNPADGEPLTYAYYQSDIKPKPAPIPAETEEEVWVCKVCGYVHRGKLPADFICPVCKHGAKDFERIDGKSTAVDAEKDNKIDINKGETIMAKYVCSICGYVHEGTEAPERCPQCKAPKDKFVLQSEDKMSWAAEHVVGIAKDVPEDIKMGLRANFEGECCEVGMYLAMSRVAHREGYPEIGLYWEKAAFEEAEHAAKFAEMLGEVVSDSTKQNLMMRVAAENGATQGKFDLAKRAKEENLDAIHDTVHEMARDEARHGKAFEGLLNRYFK